MTVPGPYGNVHEDYEARQREGLDEAVAAMPGDVRVEAGFIAGAPATSWPPSRRAVDLMVVGSRGYGPRAAVLLGGVTHTLIRKAACPVVVLPRGSRRARAAVRGRSRDRDVVIAAAPPNAGRAITRSSRVATPARCS